MTEFIFNPKDKLDSIETSFYCIKGSENYTDDNGYPRSDKDTSRVLAKKIVKTDSSPQYFVKISNNNKLFNPLDNGLEEKSYSIIDNVCKPADKFRSVNEKVFNMYLNFLTSKNIQWLTRAEREMI